MGITPARRVAAIQLGSHTPTPHTVPDRLLRRLVTPIPVQVHLEDYRLTKTCGAQWEVFRYQNRLIYRKGGSLNAVLNFQLQIENDHVVAVRFASGLVESVPTVSAQILTIIRSEGRSAGLPLVPVLEQVFAGRFFEA